VLPSVSHALSEQWSVLFIADFTRRWFDQNAGVSRQDLLLEPVATLEYAIPDAVLGGHGRALGWPAVDFQIAYERNWSNVPGGTYSAAYIGFALKAGWRFGP